MAFGTMLFDRDDDLSEFQYYHYVPSKAGAAIFALIFLISTLLHLYQMVVTRVWFMVPLCIGGICQYQLS